MPTRVRKLVGSLGVLVFLAAYVWIVTLAADHVPRHVVPETLFYVVAGVLWGVPLIPLIRWMNGGGDAS
jgi:hypothetical protein